MESDDQPPDFSALKADSTALELDAAGDDGLESWSPSESLTWVFCAAGWLTFPFIAGALGVA
jgi:hypothetical protein